MSRIDDPIDAAMAQLRSMGGLRPDNERELRAHLEDALDEARAAGMDPEGSVEETLRRFGDCREIAEGFRRVDRYRRFRRDAVLLGALKLCLWLTGGLCLAASVALNLPMGWLEAVLNLFGGGGHALPKSEAFIHLARGAAAVFVGAGVFYILLGLRPASYRPLIPFSGAAAVLFGAVVGLSGLSEGLPAFWYFKDSLVTIVLGGSIVLLSRLLGARALVDPPAGAEARC